MRRTCPKLTHDQDVALGSGETTLMGNGTIREFGLERRCVRKNRSIVWVSLAMSSIGPAGKPPSLLHGGGTGYNAEKTERAGYRQPGCLRSFQPPTRHGAFRSRGGEGALDWGLDACAGNSREHSWCRKGAPNHSGDGPAGDPCLREDDLVAVLPGGIEPGRPMLGRRRDGTQASGGAFSPFAEGGCPCTESPLGGARLLQYPRADKWLNRARANAAGDEPIGAGSSCRGEKGGQSGWRSREADPHVQPPAGARALRQTAPADRALEPEAVGRAHGASLPERVASNAHPLQRRLTDQAGPVAGALATQGRKIRNVLPLPGELSTCIQPW